MVISSEKIHAAEFVAEKYWNLYGYAILDREECLSEAKLALVELIESGVTADRDNIKRVVESRLRGLLRDENHNAESGSGLTDTQKKDPFFYASMDQLRKRHPGFCAPPITHVQGGMALTPHGARLLASAGQAPRALVAEAA